MRRLRGGVIKFNETLQAGRPAGTATRRPTAFMAPLAAPGIPLDRDARAFFEPRFGRDFTAVRVHADAGAARSAREVAAHAYTVGSDIVFAEGAYAPATDSGRRLIAHELTHVVQQTRAVRRQDAPSQDPSAPPDASVPQNGAAQPATPAAAPAKPACGIATSTPADCGDRHNAYCAAKKCFPQNPWLDCVCTASGEVCRAVDAFTFSSLEGKALLACAMTLPAGIHWSPFAPPASTMTIQAKGEWLRDTNKCIWGHWRNALEAIHDPLLPVPGGLTPQWRAAVTTCRSSGVGTKACCDAHVVAEQSAIDLCGPYDSSRFGKLPTDVPTAPACSAAVAQFSPGLPFTGDFGKVADRITYGKTRCCPGAAPAGAPPQTPSPP